MVGIYHDYEDLNNDKVEVKPLKVVIVVYMQVDDLVMVNYIHD